MAGTYPSYTYSTKSLKWDIPGRDDIWNGEDGNEINAQLVIHQGILYALNNTAIIRKVLETSANTSTYAVNYDTYNVINITGQTNAITGFTMTGSPRDGDMLRISITGTGSIAITLGPNFEASSIPLPTTTSGNSRLDIGFLWNINTALWRCVAVS